MSDQSGEIGFVITDATDIYNEIILLLEQNVGEPLYPGDERRLYGEAVVAVFVQLYNRMNDTARQSLLRYARGDVLDAIGERSLTTRLAGTPAAATAQFFVGNIVSANVVIPKGTRVTPDGVYYFATTETVVIQSGTLSVTVEIEATEPGAASNGYPVGTIETIVDLVPYVSRVTNVTVTANGDDGEPYTTAGDDHYRERVRLAPGKRSTAGPGIAYEYWATTADARICDVAVISPEPGVVTVIPLLYGGEIPDAALLSKVLEVVSDDKIRPLNDKVRVQAPTVVEYDIEFTYYMASGTAAEVIANVEGAGGAIEQYNAWQMGALGRDINPDHLRKLILAPDWADGLNGAVRVDMVSPVFTDITDIEVGKWSGVIEVRYEIVEGVL